MKHGIAGNDTQPARPNNVTLTRVIARDAGIAARLFEKFEACHLQQMGPEFKSASLGQARQLITPASELLWVQFIYVRRHLSPCCVQYHSRLKNNPMANGKFRIVTSNGRPAIQPAAGEAPDGAVEGATIEESHRLIEAFRRIRDPRRRAWLVESGLRA